MVRCGEAVQYFTSLACLILAYIWSRLAIFVIGKGRGMFLFLLYLHFHSCSSCFPVPLIHLLFYTTQNDLQGMCHLTLTQLINQLSGQFVETLSCTGSLFYWFGVVSHRENFFEVLRDSCQSDRNFLQDHEREKSTGQTKFGSN